MAALLCHGVWTSAASGDHHLVLSSAAPGQTFYCLDYRDRDGDVEGQFTRVSWEYSRRIFSAQPTQGSTAEECLLLLLK